MAYGLRAEESPLSKGKAAFGGPARVGNGTETTQPPVNGMSASGVTSPADLVKRPPLPEQVQAGATTGPGAPGRTQS